MKNLKVSIITVSFNSDNTIAETIESVQKQTYHNIEHVFIDGNSSDRTCDIIRSLKKEKDIFISEKDNGLYDAMNKGINLCTGDIIGILNSDDMLASNKTIEIIVQNFIIEKCDAVFGNLVFVKRNDSNKIIRSWFPTPYTNNSFIKGWHLPHPTFYVAKKIYNKYGLYEPTLKVSADFELMLRFIEKNKIKLVKIDSILIKMRYGGESTGSIKKIIIGNLNVLKAFKMNGYKIQFYYPLLRIIPKIMQFFIKNQ
jgi:glycosyltransferase involved in cell wall biosynthesis